MTEQRQAFEAAQRMAAIVEHSDDAIIGKTLEGIITSWNPAAARMYGYSRAEIVGKPVGLLSPKDRAGEIKEILAKVKAGQLFEHLVTERVRKDGTVFQASLTVSLIRDAAVAVVCASTIARDVTTLMQTQNQLQLANETIRGFTAAAAHDLRSPLTSIAGFSALLTKNWETFTDEDRRKFVGSVDRQAQNMSRLVDDLSTSASIEGGGLSTSPELIVLAEAIERCLELGGSDTGTVEVSCSPDLSVRVDPHHLGRILDNYVQNAFKYGQPSVRIEAIRLGDMVRVRVLDHGPGVPPEFEPRLFDKFARADPPATRAKNGTGLGLSIVRGLAEANGGQARYEPNVPHGSCFIVELPAGDRPGAQS